MTTNSAEMIVLHINLAADNEHFIFGVGCTPEYGVTDECC